MKAMRTVIYDIGANNGDNVPYYLLKADLVVAVEANPSLAERMRGRFSCEIEAGQVVVENCAVTASTGGDDVDFYLHRTNPVLSQLPRPSDAERGQFTLCRLPARSLVDIVATHGSPHYMKIDVEHYDAPLLRALFSAGVRPPFISAETHNVDVFIALVEQGGYRAFKLVDGETVHRQYVDRMVTARAGGERHRYSFPRHSAGPYGEDIDGSWLTAENVFRALAFRGFGWVDVHATATKDPDPSVQPRVFDYLDRLVKRNELHQLLFYVGRRAFRSFARRVPLPGSASKRSPVN
jgi:FkbM family methyltransferase